MEITWYGHSCFRLVERGVASIVTDPFDDTIGYGPLKLKADIVTVSHYANGHGNAQIIRDARVLDRAGEYEIGGVFITGLQAYDPNNPGDLPNTIYVLDFDSLVVCHLGDLNYVPDQSQIEAMGPIDVLLVPVGGGGALNSSQAAEVISLIEPSIVVPMHYKTDATTLALDPLERFVKEMGLATVEPHDSLKVTASSASEETQVVVLNYRLSE